MAGKLGKLPATKDKRDFKFKDFAPKKQRQIVIPPAKVGYGHWPAVAKLGVEWGMLGNDRYGDCVLAEAAHTTMIFNAVRGRAVNFNDEGVLSDYAAITGFDPRTGANDNGTDMRQAMKYRQKTGVVDANGVRHKIGAYVSLDPTNWKQLLQALYVFEAVAIGFEVPQSAMEQFDAGKPWTYVRDKNIIGGHDVPIVGRPSVSRGELVTWAQGITLTRSFYEHYNDEAWGIVSLETLDAATGKSPEGYDWPSLQEAVAAL